MLENRQYSIILFRLEINFYLHEISIMQSFAATIKRIRENHQEHIEAEFLPTLKFEFDIK
jgi:hypothetical protein